LKELAQVVLAGRQELVKIQTIGPDASLQSANRAADRQASGAVPISRARRAASRLRTMKGTG
jgi:hypothetical protein